MNSSSTSWREVSLGDICEFKYGKSLPESKRVGSKVPVYGSNGIVGSHVEAITQGPTIVVGRKGSFGEVHFSTVPCWPIDTTYYIDTTATRADLRWLTYRLSGLGLTQLNRAAAVPGLNREDAYRRRLLLPPPVEQRRIAAVLDRADSLRAKRRAALAQLDTLTQSIFLDRFGDPTTNPKGMTIVRLSDVTTRITDGVHQKPDYTESGVPFISVKDITTGVLSFNDCKFISREDHNKFTKRCRPEKSDILYTKVGATYGRPALVDTEREFSIYVSVCLIKPQKKLVDPMFLCATLGTTAVKGQADKRIKGIGVPDLHLDQIQRFLIPLPSLSEQRDFARCVVAVGKAKATHRASLAELDALFAVLQHRAFRGEL